MDILSMMLSVSFIIYEPIQPLLFACATIISILNLGTSHDRVKLSKDSHPTSTTVSYLVK